MGDTFFKTFFLGLFGLLGLVGLLTVMHWNKQATDYKEQKAFIESRGISDIPSSWRKEIGKGI